MDVLGWPQVLLEKQAHYQATSVRKASATHLLKPTLSQQQCHADTHPCPPSRVSAQVWHHTLYARYSIVFRAWSATEKCSRWGPSPHSGGSGALQKRGVWAAVVLLAANARRHEVPDRKDERALLPRRW